MNRFKKSIAAICAVSMLAQASFIPCSAEEDTVTAEKGAVAGRQLLGETDFDYKMLPWHTVEASPAKQRFEITPEGEAHMMILSAQGEERERPDLAFRYKNLDFKAGHTYELECRVKSNREGIELCSQKNFTERIHLVLILLRMLWSSIGRRILSFRKVKETTLKKYM